MIGMPEARILLAHATVMVATSPKSNSCYKALEKAMKDVETKRTGEVPMHLRNAPVKEMSDQGYGKGYKYVHDYPGNIVKQEYFPDEMAGTIYYEPTSNGYEARIKEWIEKTGIFGAHKIRESNDKEDNCRILLRVLLYFC